MKKLLILLCLFSLLAGCGAKGADTDTPSMPSLEESPQPAPQTPKTEIPADEPSFTYQVELSKEKETMVADTGERLASCSFQLPVLRAVTKEGTSLSEATTPEEELALASVDTFNLAFAQWNAAESLKDIGEVAQSDLAYFQEQGMEWAGGYSEDLQCTVYQTDHLISIVGTHYSYTGGAHPNTSFLGWNFDLTTGTFISVPSLAEDPVAFQEAVTAAIISQLESVAAEYDLPPEELFWANYEEIAADWSSYAVSFHPEGMTVTFSAYDMAPYAAGPQIFDFTYDWLETYLGVEYRSILDPA